MRSQHLIVCGGRRLSVVVLSIATFMSVDASAASWIVLHDGSGDAPTIQAAVDSCAAGDSVLVGEGTFFESVEIDVPISVIGSSVETSLVSADGEAYCFTTTGSIAPLLIESLWLLDAAPTGYGFERGFVLEGQGSIEVSDCRVSDTASHQTRGLGWSGSAHIRDSDFVGLAPASYVVVQCQGPSLVVERCVFQDVNGTAISAFVESGQVVDSRFERVTGAHSIVALVTDAGQAVVSRNLFVDSFGFGVGRFDPPVRSARRGLGTLIVESNTFVRVRSGALALEDLPFDVVEFTRNAVTGALTGVHVYSGVTFACNDVWGNDTNWEGPDLTGQNGNISAPPLYCDGSAGIFTLAANSPCLPANSPCGALIGAFGEGCGATAVAQRSWGAIKGLYR